MAGRFGPVLARGIPRHGWGEGRYELEADGRGASFSSPTAGMNLKTAVRGEVVEGKAMR